MNPRLEEYIERHISEEPELLRDIDRRSNLYQINGRMCSGHIQGRLLKMFTSMISPLNVIELGTFTGYSALCMAEALPENGVIHTIEADDELEEEITRNLAMSPHGRKVKLHIGQALDVLEKFKPESFDMALIDADKREYAGYFKKLMPLIKPGGYILADNTLWDAHVIEEGRHSSQTKGIMEFNDLVASFPGIETAIMPVRDGLTIIRKLPKSD